MGIVSDTQKGGLQSRNNKFLNKQCSPDPTSPDCVLGCRCGALSAGARVRSGPGWLLAAALASDQPSGKTNTAVYHWNHTSFTIPSLSPLINHNKGSDYGVTSP